MDLIEINSGDLPGDMRRIALAPLLEQHRKRWMLRTCAGDVLLKRITALEAEQVTLDAMADPDFVGMVERAHVLSAKAAGPGLEGDELREYLEVGARLAPFAKRIALKCIVSPEVRSDEEYDVLLNALSTDERRALEDLLRQLSRTDLDGEVTTSALALSEKYGIPLAPDLTVENMTAQQSAALSQRVSAENDRLAAMLRRK
ncbi:MAG TPA: hypothetical protein PLJ11_07350 [Methanomassiliicoccales archaeon]|nr:hypothetical protein [Methanomassiliicoccales archaeon]